MLRQQGTSSPLVCPPEKRLRQTDKSSPSLTASGCFSPHLLCFLKSFLFHLMWWGWYRQVVPLACQLVKNKIRVPSGTLILFPPLCLYHRCYLLMGFAPETPGHKNSPSAKGMVSFSVFAAIVPWKVADSIFCRVVVESAISRMCYEVKNILIPLFDIAICGIKIRFFTIRFLLFLYPASARYHISRQNHLTS